MGVGILLLSWVVAELPPGFHYRRIFVRSGLLIAALGLCFAFDDPAAPVSDPAPMLLRTRRLLRLGIYLVPWAISVVAVLWGGAHLGTTDADAMPAFPWQRLTLEASAMAAVGLAISAVISKRWDDEPGRMATPTLLAVYGMSWLLPWFMNPWPVPTDSRWAPLIPWWWTMLGVGLVVVIWFSWDARRYAWRSVLMPSAIRGEARGASQTTHTKWSV